MSKLIINADDFGLHTAVNEGIISGHTKGVITSTSLLQVVLLLMSSRNGKKIS